MNLFFVQMQGWLISNERILRATLDIALRKYIHIRAKYLKIDQVKIVEDNL